MSGFPFNEKVMDHVHRPRNSGPLEDATAVGCSGIPGEGRYIKLYLVVVDDTIEQAAYECNGCPASIASASVVCEVVTGRETSIVEILEANDILVMLGGLPDGKEELPQMALDALRQAVKRPV
jgi:NifU-like protein involved in Fe-S cluster formation